MKNKGCAACGKPRPKHRPRWCSEECHRARAPAVYRFVCPDGRSYVGGVLNIEKRGEAFARKNPRIEAVLAQFPPPTWRFEVLERLEAGCSERELRIAEQRHIDRLRSWSPDCGFNVHPAIWEGDGPSQRAGRQFRAEVIRRVTASLSATGGGR